MEMNMTEDAIRHLKRKNNVTCRCPRYSHRI